MTRTLCISNEKGGVAKTTTAINIAHALTLIDENIRILLIDFDPQGSASIALGLPPAPATRRLLLGNESVKNVATEARQRLDVITSNHELADVRDWLGMKSARDRDGAIGSLAAALHGQLKPYDFVLIDNAPSIDILTLTALMASDELLIPVSVDFLSAAGTNQKLETLQLVQDMGGAVVLTGIIPTRHDARLNRSKRILALLQETFGELVTHPIRTNTHLAEAAHYGQTIFEHKPKSIGATDYMRLAEHIYNG